MLVWAPVTVPGKAQVFGFASHVSRYRPLALTTVTTTRKFFTVLGSIFYYKHAMEERQWVAVVLVFTGLALDIVRGFLIANEERRDVEKKDK